MKKKKRWKRAALSGAFAVLAGGWMGGGGMGNNSWIDGRILCGGSGRCGTVLAAERETSVERETFAGRETSAEWEIFAERETSAGAENSYLVSGRQECRRLLMELVSSAPEEERQEFYVTGEDYEPETLVIAQMFPGVKRISNTRMAAEEKDGKTYITCRIGFEKFSGSGACGHRWEETTLEEAGCLSYGRIQARCALCKVTEELSLAPLGHEDEDGDSLCGRCLQRTVPQRKGDEIRVGLDGGILPDNQPGSLSFVCLEEEYEGGMLYGCLEEISAEAVLKAAEEIEGTEEERIRWWLENGFLNGISVKPACQKLLLLDAGGVPIQPGDWKAGKAVRPGLVLTVPDPEGEAERNFWRTGDIQLREVNGVLYRFCCIDDDYADGNSNYQNQALFLCETVIRSDIESTDSQREILPFGENSNYKYSQIRQWLLQAAGDGPEAPSLVYTGVNTAFEGKTADGTFFGSGGEGLSVHEIPLQVINDRMFLLSAEEALQYPQAWEAEGTGSAYSRGYWLRTPGFSVDAEGNYQDGTASYVVDLERGCLRQADVSDTSFGIRPAYCLPQAP